MKRNFVYRCGHVISSMTPASGKQIVFTLYYMTSSVSGQDEPNRAI